MTPHTRCKPSPFVEEILLEGLPANCRIPHLGEYDSTTDPEEHMCKFENAVLLHQFSDAIKCRVFVTNLASEAQKWYQLLCPGPITCFEDLGDAFLQHFFSCKK